MSGGKFGNPKFDDVDALARWSGEDNAPKEDNAHMKLLDDDINCLIGLLDGRSEPLELKLELARNAPCIFRRNPYNWSQVSAEKNPLCDWVFDGEGMAYELDSLELEEGKIFYSEPEYTLAQRSHLGIRGFLSQTETDGILFVHPDGRRGKIEKRDFGLPRKPEVE